MFYGGDKVITYPNKTILEDVLTRDGEPTTESFSPFRGCARLITQQFAARAVEVEIGDILAVSKDFSLEKAKANDDVNRDYDTSQVVAYYTKLENVKQYFIENYVTQVLIGYKKNAKGIRKKEKELPTQFRWYDEESDRYVSESDIKQKEHAFTTEEILEARAKLPYLLKQLHNGSIVYRGSLLSFIIAAEKCYEKHKSDLCYIPKPGELVQQGVYRVNSLGNTTTKFKASDNTAEPYRGLVAWVKGRDLDGDGRIYYKAYQELLRVLDILDIDITKEDATKYNNEFIRKAVCTYLASNEEYVDTYGFVDKKIIGMLTPDQLFSIQSKMTVENVKPKRITNNVKADSIATNTEILKIKAPNMWSERPDVVNKFLREYCTMHQIPVKQVRDYDVCKGLLAKGDGSYVIIPVRKIKDYCTLPPLAVVSIAGYLIIVEDIVTHIEYLGMDEAILRMRRISSDTEWYRYGI